MYGCGRRKSRRLKHEWHELDWDWRTLRSRRNDYSRWCNRAPHVVTESSSSMSNPGEQTVEVVLDTFNDLDKLKRLLH